MKIEQFIDKIFIQSTGQCNLNCSYCYVPNRELKRQIELSTIQNIVSFIKSLKKSVPLDIIWHSGEPLMINIKNFKKILNLFKSLNVNHRIQTNAILLNNDWCDLIDEYNIKISVSIDGNESQNSNRVNWSNEETFNLVTKKIRLLEQRNIEFNIICVVHEKNISSPKGLFNFLKNIKSSGVAFSVVEKENYNKNNNDLNVKDLENFWTILFDCWKNDHAFKIREFNLIFSKFISPKDFNEDIKYLDLNVSFGFNGDLVILSPEFLDAHSSLYNNFIIGNINHHTNKEIIELIKKSSYLKDHLLGIEKCYSECSYFNFCEGGNASNKYFENGLINSTETNHCFQTKQILVDSILKKI